MTYVLEFQFLKEMKLNGKLNNIAKTSKKDHLITAYNAMFEKKAFRQSDEPTLDEKLEEAQLAKKTAAMAVAEEKKKEAEKEAADAIKEVCTVMLEWYTIQSTLSHVC